MSDQERKFSLNDLPWIKAYCDNGMIKYKEDGTPVTFDTILGDLIDSDSVTDDQKAYIKGYIEGRKKLKK